MNEQRGMKKDSFSEKERSLKQLIVFMAGTSLFHFERTFSELSPKERERNGKLNVSWNEKCYSEQNFSSIRYRERERNWVIVSRADEESRKVFQ